MIYSRWIPDRGDYEYLEAAERRGLGDDLPVPLLSPSSPIGFPSTEAGRKAPSGLRPVGRGAWAKGMILPMQVKGLSGTGLGEIPGSIAWWLFLGVAAIAAYKLYDAARHR